MRNFFYLLLFLLAIQSADAQIVLTPNAAPTSGTTTVDYYSFGMCSTNYGNYYSTDTEERYSYTAVADVPCASINLDPNVQYTGVFVFEAALPTSSSTSCIASAYSGVFGNTDPVTANFSMTSGTTYYFIVTSEGEGDVSFSIDLDVPVIPTPYVVMSNASVTVSDATPLNFYDSGGPSCEYQLNENYTLTVCPDAAGVSAGKLIQLEFTDFDRDGNCLTSSEITFYKGSSATPGQEIFPSEYANIVYTEDVRIFTSIVAGGCMTIVWENGNDANCEGTGWEGVFTLVDNPCSTPISDICSTAPLLMLGSTLESNTECFTGGSGACGIGNNNNGWFKFIASSTSASIDYEITGGNACYASEPGETSVDETSDFTGIQLLLYAGCAPAQQICTTVLLATGGINVENGNYASGTWTVNDLTNGAEYYAQFDSYGSDLCNFTVTGGVGVALPVEFLSFTATPKANTNQLVWSTAIEENTSVHVVERASSDNIFKEIGFVKAKGNAIQQTDYIYEDSKPISVANYRIKTKDIDGSVSYSKTVTVVRKQNLSVDLVWPNPTHDFVAFSVRSETNQDARLYLKDLKGRLVLEKEIELLKGEQEIELDLTKLDAGVYFLKIVTKNTNLSLKVSKL